MPHALLWVGMLWNLKYLAVEFRHAIRLKKKGQHYCTAMNAYDLFAHCSCLTTYFLEGLALYTEQTTLQVLPQLQTVTILFIMIKVQKFLMIGRTSGAYLGILYAMTSQVAQSGIVFLVRHLTPTHVHAIAAHGLLLPGTLAFDHCSHANGSHVGDNTRPL